MSLFNNKTMKSTKQTSICTYFLCVWAWHLRRLLFSSIDHFQILTLKHDLNVGEVRKEATDMLLIGCLDCRQTLNTKEASMCQTSINFELCLGPHTQKKVSLKRKPKRGNQKVNPIHRNQEEASRDSQPLPCCHPPEQLPPQPPYLISKKGPTPYLYASSRSS